MNCTYLFIAGRFGKVLWGYCCVFGLLLVGCQSPTAVEPSITPPVVPIEPTTLPPTEELELVVPTESSLVEVEPVNPTAVSTAPAPATPTPNPTATAVPTATPRPVTAVDSIQLTQIATGFFQPLGIDHAGDNRLFITQQHGVISIIADGQILSEPFLSITDRANSGGYEQGLLGLAFHPDYANNGRFFVNYTRADDATVIAEFAVDPNNPDRALPSSERILLTIPQPYRNHNGGQLKFGPDGFLYIGTGDGGSANDPPNNGQRTDTLLGKMLRLDVDGGEPYGVPASNPFVNDDAVRNEIWATGLRNPWRFSFDRETGDLYIADVGQNEWEEINFQPYDSGGGENYGWRIFEASNCHMDDCSTLGLTNPAFEYNHAGGHCSVTGGYMYRGEQYPDLYGNYFLADYCSGQAWRMVQIEGEWHTAVVGNFGFLVSTFGEDAQGELYIADHNSGTIYQITP